MDSSRRTATVVLAAVLVLSGCADAGVPETKGQTSSAAASDSLEPHNAADTEFAAMMVPHHAQALAMTDLVIERDDLDPTILEIAKKSKAVQAPQLDELLEWSAVWGDPRPSDGPTEVDAMGHTGMSMDVLSIDQMNQLADATAEEAAELYLSYMIEHNQGALAMAEAEIAEGMNPAAVALAEEIAQAQAAELAAMQTALAG